MKKRSKFVIGLAVMLAVALVVGLTSLAAESGYGSQTDPLVTLSYLNTTFTDAIMAKFNARLEERAAELSGADPTTVNVQSGFSVLTLTSGQTLRCAVGTEIMLRVGSAVSAGPDAPRLIDETGGSNVSNEGTELVKNHMYMVTIIDNGIKATAGTVKVLIRGTYTIV